MPFGRYDTLSASWGDPHDLVQPCILAEVTGATSFFPCTASFSVPSKVGKNWCEWLCLGFSKLIMESFFL